MEPDDTTLSLTGFPSSAGMEPRHRVGMAAADKDPRPAQRRGGEKARGPRPGMLCAGMRWRWSLFPGEGSPHGQLQSPLDH